MTFPSYDEARQAAGRLSHQIQAGVTVWLVGPRQYAIAAYKAGDERLDTFYRKVCAIPVRTLPRD
jgi:hypothetical protein